MGRKRCKPRTKVDNAFYNAWHILEKEGACDLYGGLECVRVYGEWLDAGSPRPVGEFIRQRANADSSGKSAPPSTPTSPRY